MIGSFCFLVFALAFHARTRPWGLIGSLSFAGATSIVLGIDCFSRAGLKEFWIYIWALNDNIFPLGTDTYPHTRGMKVEIAGIFVIFALGVMSQMKLWKILQERREAKEILRRQQEADLEAVDEESGKRVEAEYQAERGRWEAAYGNRKPSDSGDSKISRPTTGGSKADSGLGDDEIRGSGELAQGFVETSEMREAREGHIQMVEMGRHPPSREEPGVHEQQLQPRSQDDGAIPLGVEDAPPYPSNLVEGDQPPRSATNSPSASRRNSYDKRRASSQAQKQPGEAGPDATQEHEQQSDVRPQAPPPPAVVPLPLPILHEGGDDDDDDGSSVATRADSDHFSLDEQQPGRFSLASDAPRMDLPYDRASKASSLAATCDERLEAEDDGLPELTTEIARSTPGLELDSGATPTEPPPLQESVVEAHSEKVPEEAAVQAVESADLKNSNVGVDHGGILASSEPQPDTSVSPAPSTTPPTQPPLQLLPQDLVPSSYPKSKASSSVSRNDIQTQCSKVVKTFRTNEWAKHLTEADKPDPEEIPFAQAVESDEKPAPLDFEELQGTSDVSQKPVVSQKESRRSVSASGGPPSSASAAAALPASVLALAPAQRTSFRASSAPQAEKPPLEQHSVPFAADQPRHGPLIDRAVSAAPVREEDRFPKEGTLLGQRETMVRSRASFTNYGRYDSPSPSSTPVSRGSGDPQRSGSAISFGAPMQQQAGSIPRATLSRQSSNLDTLSDDMPLADRQQLLHQSISQQSLTRRSWNPLPPAVVAPQRRATPMPPQQHPDKRAEMFSSWREGMRTDHQQQEFANTVDQRRAEMLNERNQAAMLGRQKMMQGNLRGTYMEERMRQRDMLELHNEAIRKIQATANKNAR